jgi:hypothetical protein
VAAKPVTPSVEAMRGWIASLEQGLARNDRSVIYGALRDAVAGLFRRGGVGGQRRLARRLMSARSGAPLAAHHRGKPRARVHDRAPARRHQLVRFGD